MPHDLVHGILKNNHGSISKAITLIENSQSPPEPFFSDIHKNAFNSVRIGITGPPGAGKGTQSKFIEKQFNLYQLSTGDLLRDEVKNKTELGLKISSIMNSGQLVCDEIVGNLIVMFVSIYNYKVYIILRNLIKIDIEALRDMGSLRDLFINLRSFH